MYISAKLACSAVDQHTAPQSAGLFPRQSWYNSNNNNNTQICGVPYAKAAEALVKVSAR